MSTSRILTQAQAEAVYSAMCNLNNVFMRLDGCVGTGIRCHEDENGEVFVFKTLAGHTGGPREEYANQTAFAAAYGLGFVQGDEVQHGDYRGTIVRHYYDGMWEVRFPGGVACVPGTELKPVSRPL
ncbi:hypothetical protein C8245_22985 [Paracidovorax avenae]|uniref:hypothetical protein n=1 Tax=Paracidovorax avenae TaxID=80867 RepID=UPI000D210D49|nr:hypothetical protein [Paracidovorax avenae]AVS68144.1 hypothetical protein C8245_22985 [Paracidovorax avenae]